MKRPLSLLAVICSIWSLLAATAALAAPVRNVTPAEARELLQKNSRVYLLDVRTPGEFQQMSIEGAHLIPIDQFVARINEVPKNQPIVVYCAVGARSSQVSDYLARLGYPEVYNMSGGIMGWQVRGYPTRRGTP